MPQHAGGAAAGSSAAAAGSAMGPVVKTRAFYVAGEDLAGASHDEHRQREYKSVLQFLANAGRAGGGSSGGGGGGGGGASAVELVRRKCAAYVNGFLNSLGGTVYFGVREDDATGGNIVEAAPFGREERKDIRRAAETIVKRM